MKPTTPLTSLLPALCWVALTFAFAQTTASISPSIQASGAYSCQAQPILEACKSTENTQIGTCKPNDWVCLCDNYKNLLTCYNNCPESPEKPPVQNQVLQYCDAAAPLKSASSASAASAGSTATQTSSAGAMASASESKAVSGTAARASASSTAAAGMVAAPVGGVIAVVLGVVGLV